MDDPTYPPFFFFFSFFFLCSRMSSNGSVHTYVHPYEKSEVRKGPDLTVQNKSQKPRACKQIAADKHCQLSRIESKPLHCRLWNTLFLCLKRLFRLSCKMRFQRNIQLSIIIFDSSKKYWWLWNVSHWCFASAKEKRCKVNELVIRPCTSYDIHKSIPQNTRNTL